MCSHAWRQRAGSVLRNTLQVALKKGKPEKVQRWSKAYIRGSYEVKVSILDEGLSVPFNMKKKCKLSPDGLSACVCAKENNSFSDYFYLLSPEVKPIESLLGSNSNSSWQTLALVSVGAAAPDTTSSRNETSKRTKQCFETFQSSDLTALSTSHTWRQIAGRVTQSEIIKPCLTLLLLLSTLDVWPWLEVMVEIQSGLLQTIDLGSFM